MTDLLWIGVTLFAYAAGEKAQRWCRNAPIVHPVAIAIVLTTGALTVTEVSVASYQHSTAILTMLLGAATVALAVVTYRHLQILIENIWPITLSCVVGGLGGGTIAAAAAVVLDASNEASISVLTHSTTTAVSIDLTRVISGSVAIATVSTLATGILGAALGPTLLRFLRIVDPRAVGLALGVGSHAIGTAKAVELGPVAGAFAAIGLSVNAIVSSIAIFTAVRLGAIPI